MEWIGRESDVKNLALLDLCQVHPLPGEVVFKRRLNLRMGCDDG